MGRERQKYWIRQQEVLLPVWRAMLSRDEDESRRIERLQDHQVGTRRHQTTQYYLRDHERSSKAPAKHVRYGECRQVPLHLMVEYPRHQWRLPNFFDLQVTVLGTFGWKLPNHMLLVKQKLIGVWVQEPKYEFYSEQKRSEKAVVEEYLTCLMLSRADNGRYLRLNNNIENIMLLGSDN